MFRYMEYPLFSSDVVFAPFCCQYIDDYLCYREFGVTDQISFLWGFQ